MLIHDTERWAHDGSLILTWAVELRGPALLGDSYVFDWRKA